MQTKNAPSSEVTICGHTYDEYIDKIRAFHGYTAPGVVIGGFMVDLAYRNLPQGELFDAICETRKSLPDAIQLLTPCTIGNGWLKIIDLGRFALSIYEKHTGNGVRVYVDSNKLAGWHELETFFFKLRPDKEQDPETLLDEINLAQTSIFGIQRILIKPEYLKSGHRDALAICPNCNEGFPVDDGEVCLGCQGEAPYIP